ncbi:MAG TPA: hypothetical protein VJR89_10585 [Polyangiales bacterium]|nr:hypothetical protein [Polyangiales bacterium]
MTKTIFPFTVAALAMLWGFSGSTAQAEGRDGDARPRVVILSPAPGASNLGPQLRIETLITCRQLGACAENPAATRALVAKKLRLRDPSGAVIDVVPEASAAPAASPGKPAPAASELSPQYSAVYLPASKLNAATAYTLELESDDQVVLGFATAAAPDLTAAAMATKAKRALHSGKLALAGEPVPARIERSNDENKPVRSLRVVFSEPVALATLANDGLRIVQGNGQALRGCAWSALENACASAKSVELTSIVDFVFDQIVEAQALSAFSLDLSGAVSGTGATLAEAAAKRGLSQAADARGPRVAIAVRAADWQDCTPRGDVRCVRELVR